MIRPEYFVDQLIQRGSRIFSGVPCSYLTPLINTVIETDSLHYVGAANEGDAVATAAGAAIGGAPASRCSKTPGLATRSVR